MFFSWIQRDGPWVLLFFLFFASILCPCLMLLIFPVHLPVKQHVEFSFHCSSIKDTETPDMSVTKSKDRKWGKLKTTRTISEAVQSQRKDKIRHKIDPRQQEDVSQKFDVFQLEQKFTFIPILPRYSQYPIIERETGYRSWLTANVCCSCYVDCLEQIITNWTERSNSNKWYKLKMCFALCLNTNLIKLTRCPRTGIQIHHLWFTVGHMLCFEQTAVVIDT